MNIAFKILFFSLLLDLSGKSGIRDYGLLISLSFLIFKKKNIFIKKELLIYFFVFIVYPTMLLLKSSIEDALVYKTQFFSTVQIFIIFLVIQNYSYKVIFNNFLQVIKVVQIAILTLFIGNILEISFFESILTFLGKPYDGGYFGYLRLGGMKFPQIYLKSTLIFVFPAIHFFMKNDYKNSILSLSVLLVSISKAGFVLALIAIIIYSLNKLSFKKVFYIFIIFTVLILSLGWYLDILMNISDSYTAQKRVSQLDWFISYIANNPISFLFGQGFGHYFNVNGVIDFAIELDHLDVIRKYGFVWFLIISFPFVLSILKFKKEINLAYPYLFLYIAVGTNPLLITNIFFIISYIIIKSLNEEISNSNTYLERNT